MEDLSLSGKAVGKFLGVVKNTITEYRMIQPCDRILVALSGGPDSVALLRTLMALRTELSIENIGAAHLNHLLRKETAQKDQIFARNLAHEYRIPFFTRSLDVGNLAACEKLSMEAAGRKARYDFFHQLAAEHGFTRIATGHNRDDNAEQVLMALIRGAGPTGMKGIAPIRGIIIRPLIRLAKSRITEFLDWIDQDFVVDASNEDPVFLRNRIRNQLIPLLEKEYNPNIRKTLDRNAAIFQEDESFWETLTEKTYPQCIAFSDPGEVGLKISSLLELPPALVNRILRKALFQIKTNLHRISLVHIRAIRTLMTESPSGKTLDLPGQIRIYKNRQILSVRKESLPLRKLGRKKHPHSMPG
ncbi:MAG: tRNA lysidine(34) synthetase TilS [Desulfobacterales bacterium]|nr:MAG: tRNA lysidine(34) synthetase TilS [Desulfobacterales bacterium]